MDALLLVNYLAKQAKVSGTLQELLGQATNLLLRKEELRTLEKEHLNGILILTMDNNDLEYILNQLKFKHEQQCITQKHLDALYKHAIELCRRVRNIDWKAQAHCKMQLMQLQFQNESRQLSEEYEMKHKRRRELEQRPIVQKARAVQREVSDVQTKLNNFKKATVEHQTKLLDQQRQLRNARNAIIVYMVKGSKEIVDLEKELEKINASHEQNMKELQTQKQDLTSKLQRHNAKLPDSNTGNTAEKESLSKLDNSPVTSKLEPFPKLGNVCNATTICTEQNKPSFLELFKEWEKKSQLQLQQIMTTSKTFSEKAPIKSPIVIETTSLETTHVRSKHFDEPLNDGLNTTPRSILRRPCPADEDGSELVVIPKKRLRFADPEMDESKDAFLTEATMNGFEDANTGEEKRTESVENATFVIEENAKLPFNGDTETIEIFSTADMEEREMSHSAERTKQKLKKPGFLKANKLLKRAKLMGSQKMAHKVSKPSKSTAANSKPKIEIHECRIVKLAGTKLPTKRPIELSPQPQTTISPKTHKNTTNVSLATNTDNKVFKSPQKPQKRKMPDCDTFFRDSLQQQPDSTESSEEDYKTEKAKTDSLLTFGESTNNKGDEKSKSHPKRKKTEMDFDRFFRENVMVSDESENKSKKLEAPATTKEDMQGDDDDFLQFDMKYNESANFFGSNADDFFAGQTNSGKIDDADLLTFDFDGEENGKTDDFL